MQSVPERLAALEERVKHITDQLDKISERVDEIYSVMERGKGAKWMILFISALLSAILGSGLHKLVPFL